MQRRPGLFPSLLFFLSNSIIYRKFHSRESAIHCCWICCS